MRQKLCGWAGCNRLIPEGHYFCDYHKDISDQRRKESAFKTAQRHADYSNPEWRRLSHEVIKSVGHCEMCGARQHLQAHHKIPVRLAPELFLCRDNLQVLCVDCHRVVTAQQQQRKKADR